VGGISFPRRAATVLLAHISLIAVCHKPSFGYLALIRIELINIAAYIVDF
jgi:hypothetical protein